MKLLVVEDELRIAQYLKKGLVTKSHIVDLAHDGIVGLDLALAESYDAIILDWMLPSMSGIEICKRLREEDNHTPILLLTARDEVTERVAGLEAGADDYLPKPFAFIELLARIRAITRRPKATNEAVFTEDSLLLDPVSLRVTRAGEELGLSKKEFALLEFLLRHKNQVFTAEALTERVWEYDSSVLPNTAQVFIGYLRKKIDQAFPTERPLLHTVRGFGYKLGVKS
ncbi:MAG: DNA-binding response regulator [Candidatus Pacebacteria bacterium CG10_big_fil_rev_8_21_14_0_10_44_54]|nr:response regulator transcription factor [bacterium]PIR60294.1 MAG: DNA-binding response regulator [Candidatus Pacebacteria bacterium CG10_big_fil_rev_8_21_14_0_10_44_54]